MLLKTKWPVSVHLGQIKIKLVPIPHPTKSRTKKKLEHQLLGYSLKNRRKIKDDAIPTLHLPKIGFGQDTSCSERSARSVRQNIMSHMMNVGNTAVHQLLVDCHNISQEYRQHLAASRGQRVTDWGRWRQGVRCQKRAAPMLLAALSLIVTKGPTADGNAPPRKGDKCWKWKIAEELDTPSSVSRQYIISK